MARNAESGSALDRVGNFAFNVGAGALMLGVGLNALGLVGGSAAALSSPAALGPLCDTTNAVSGIVG